jgi:hypothetical protein
MTLAYALADSHVICYRLQSEAGQIKLRLWEPSHPQEGAAQNSPYLYAVNFSFPTLREAEQFLHDCLMVNGAFDVPEANFPAEGQIEILAYPTWGMETP